MKLFALFGRPVAHSLSPEMHRAAFAVAGIEAEYLRIDCGEQEMPRLAELVRRGPISGANITVPHKLLARELADEASEEADRLGAANTWTRQGGKLVAHNTDGAGFLLGLADVTIQRPSALILGAGGAARAIALALTQQGYSVTVAARTPGKAGEAFASLGANLLPWPEAARIIPTVGLLVNATTVGMGNEGEAPTGIDLGNCMPGTVVYDIVYRPRTTALLASAAAFGLPTVGGLAMLVGQGAASFELWFGRPAPLAAMMEAVEKETD